MYILQCMISKFQKNLFRGFCIVCFFVKYALINFCQLICIQSALTYFQSGSESGVTSKWIDGFNIKLYQKLCIVLYTQLHFPVRIKHRTLHFEQVNWIFLQCNKCTVCTYLGKISHFFFPYF